jgi:hypothetical protein
VSGRTQKQALVAAVVIILIGSSFYLVPRLFKTKVVHEAAPTSDYIQIGAKTTPTMTPAQESPQPSQTAVAAVPASPSPKPATPTIVAGGTFRSAPGERIQGTAHIIKIGSHYVVRLEDDFKLGSSPDPIVTLGNGNKADLSFNLGQLKGDQGSQNYDVPDSVAIANYHQVIIYCRAYHIPLGYADLTQTN